MGPIEPILLLIGGFYLLYDEIKTTMTGGESLISRFAELPFIKFIIGQVEDAIEAFKDLYATIDKVLGATEKFFKAKEYIGNKIKETFQIIGDYVVEKNETRAFLKNTRSTGLSNIAPAMKYLSEGLEYKPIEPITRTLTTSMSEYKSKQVTNNIKNGDIQITINSTGNIDEASLPKLAKLIKEEVSQAVNDPLGFQLSLAKTNLAY
jgi:hypothetical protein